MGSDSIEQQTKAVELSAAAQAEAERKGAARGARLRAAEKAMRDALIVQRVHESWTWPMIAEESGISVRQAQRVWESFRDQASPWDVDPSVYVEELARGYRITVGQFTALAATADNTAAAVGALKGANDAREKMMALMQSVGIVPEDLGTLKLHRDVRAVAVEMLDTMDAFERGELTAEMVTEVFREMMGIGTGTPAPAAA